MKSGIGSEANVIDETDFLFSSTPPLLPEADYILGIGDTLKFTQLSEFSNLDSELPPQSTKTNYVLGIGDELTLIQLNENKNSLVPSPSEDKSFKNTILAQKGEGILKTSGLVGTDGNILLLGLGSIKASNRSLKDIQTEVRNILIRNGLAPSFQLEITGFNSKKAFISFPNPENDFGYNILPITNLPITLKELAINYGVRPSSQKSTSIVLTRNGSQFRYTLGESFDETFSNIIIQDRDQIVIEVTAIASTDSTLVVGTKGNILIPTLGSFKAENRSLNELHKDIHQALINKRFVPNFQLEITGYLSKSFFIIASNIGSQKVYLNNSKLTLKEAVLNNGLNFQNDTLTVVELSRDNISYRITFQDLLSGGASRVFVQDGDIIELKALQYKPAKVFALSGAGNAQLVPINPSKRETLALQLKEH